MDMLTGIYNAFSSFTDWVWGIPILIVLVGGGIVLAVVVEGIQFIHLPFIFKTTLGSLGEKKSSDGISPLQGMIAALSATIGTGNIVGVGTAIAMGGPGALFWMWVCGFMAMGIKYSEVTLSCVYRQPDGKGGYKGGPFMYIRDGVKSKGMAVLFGIMMLVCLSLICSVHSSAITSNLASIGVPSLVSCIVMAAFIIIVIWGGMKTLVKITDKLVPVMGVLYLILALIVIIANIGNIGTVFASIFEGAFSGWAAVGGFTGATIATTIRYGLARGVFSNDAGLGLSATVQSQVEDIGCPAKQGSWAVIETFLDTIVICTITGLVILFSGTWQSGGTGATLTTGAIGEVVGTPGQVLAIICLFLFGLSSLITDAEGVRLQAVSMFGSYGIGRGFQIVVLILVILGSLADISTVFVFADFANAIILVINIAAMLMLAKVLRKETQEYFRKKQ
ncbi:MAG: amino acid carrier protein [Lachnospiraceae bacterium]|nr:amino acid carrier protein [Lachnospiraceae bacterium]